MRAATESIRRRLTLLDLVVLTVVAVIALVSVPYPFMGDQAMFSMAAHKLSQGAVLYRDFWDFKQPGIYFFYLIAGRAFGFSEIGVHLLEATWMMALSVILVATLGSRFKRRWIGSLLPLMTVGCYYGVAVVWHRTQLEALVGLPIFLSALFCSSSDESRLSWRRFFLAGGFGGIAVLFKMALAPILAAFLVAAIVPAVRRKTDRPWLAAAQVSLAWAAGMALPLAVTAVYFASNGALPAALETTFNYPVRVVAQYGSPPLFSPRLRASSWWFVRHFLGFILLAVPAVWVALTRRARPLSLQMVLWLILGAGVIVAQLYSKWEYHFLIFVVPVAVLAAEGIETLLDFLERYPAASRLRTGEAVALLCLLVSFFAPGRNLLGRLPVLTHPGLFLGSPEQAQYYDRISPEYESLRAEVSVLRREDTRPGDVTVLGSPVEFTLGGRLQAGAQNGWAPDLMLPEHWLRFRCDLAQFNPPYVLVSKGFEGEILQRRSLETVRFLAAHYSVWQSTALNVWYVPKPVGGPVPGSCQ